MATTLNLGGSAVAPIYMQQLYNASVSGVSPGVVYTVPAGYHVVLTNLDGLFTATAGSQLYAVTVGASQILRHVSAAVETLTLQWAGRQVITAGQTIKWLQGGGFSTLAVSGYVLTP